MLRVIQEVFPGEDIRPADERERTIDDMTYQRLQELRQVIDEKRDEKFNKRIDDLVDNQLAKTAQKLKSVQQSVKTPQELQGRSSQLVGCDFDARAAFFGDQDRPDVQLIRSRMTDMRNAVFEALFSTD